MGVESPSILSDLINEDLFTKLRIDSKRKESKTSNIFNTNNKKNNFPFPSLFGVC